MDIIDNQNHVAADQGGSPHGEAPRRLTRSRPGRLAILIPPPPARATRRHTSTCLARTKTMAATRPCLQACLRKKAEKRRADFSLL